MGRPEPVVLFAQTFVHSQLDEYVDEVIFSEPIVITACEFLEQNASSASPAVTLMGATSPPSFALEAFVLCEGEIRFRRLCQPFLYSHSSSNILEVEAAVTNRFVVRGTYRSLSLVIYGNTAEDLGQFNIEVDLDSSLTNTVSAVEGSLEDLPPALHRTNPAIEKLICPLKSLSLELVASDLSVEIKQFLHLTFKILELSNLGDAINSFVNSVVSAASSHATHSLCHLINNQSQSAQSRPEKCNVSFSDLTETRKELLHIYNSLQHNVSESSSMFSEFEAEPATSKQLIDVFSQYFSLGNNLGNSGHPQISRNKNTMLWLSLALFLCSGKDSCYHFVNGGGMKQLEQVFSHHGLQNSSSAVTLMLLGVVERATRHSIGCEGLLGWWPRKDENVPSGKSECYNQLLKLLLQKKQRHDVASLSMFILNRMRCYEVASRYEYAVLSVLEILSSVGKVTSVTLDMLSSAKLQLKILVKLIDCHGPIEDPSPVACASRSLLLGESESLLSYKATSTLITSSNCCFLNRDIDPHLLFLLKERGFLPLSAALLASSTLRSETGHAMDLFLDITSYIEAIILSLLCCRSGLLFLLLDPELARTVILALRGDDLRKEESIPLRYASFLISKGIFCHPREVGMIVETHLRVINAIDSLILSKPQSEDLLWSLWELCCLSRSNCGRQALLAVGHFPEAVGVLMATLHYVKELDTVSLLTGASPLNLAIFHSAVEIFEAIVTDPTASSLGSWIEHAKELHKALHSSSPGSSRKDAPTRLLEWIDASVVYHRTGAYGLLRYAAVLASGGDAHIASSNIDAMDAENVGDISGGSDGNLIDNLVGKPINEARFLGVALRDSSVAQLTTAFRILALISDNAAVAAALYDEGAIVVIHAILIDCKLMLERSSNNYDYLVDEGTECNSTSDLLLERNREQGVIDLLIPSLVLLINLLKRLQEAKEQHRNTKLLKALLQLHREVSPKLAACSTDLFYPYPDFALGFEAVCHLLASSLACWPLYGWSPGLFDYLLDSLHATSMLALGPKETCSLLFLLNDLLPEEGVWVWKNGMPILSALRTLAVGTLLGPQKEGYIDWYLQTGNPEKLLSQLTPQLDKIAQIILHYAASTLVVIQDMLRVFIVRIACLSANSASILLKPIILWIRARLSDLSMLPDTDVYKVYRLLDFLAILLEHPRAKPLLLKEGAVQMFSGVLEICMGVISSSDANQFLESKNLVAKYGVSQLSWCIPVFKSISLVCDSSRTSVQYPGLYDRHNLKNLTAKDCSSFLSYCLQMCKVLPIGRELLACLSAFKALGFSVEGRSALQSIYLCLQESEADSNKHDDTEWKKRPPLLCCWLTLLRCIATSEDVPQQIHAIEAVGALSSGALRFSMDGKSLNMDRVVALKYLFGLPHDVSSGTDGFSSENIKYVQQLISLLDSKISEEDEYSAVSNMMNTTLSQVKESAESLLLLLQKSTSFDQGDGFITSAFPLSLIDVQDSSKVHRITNITAERVEDYSLSGFGNKFLWECPETLRDRMSQTATVKRKMSLDGVSRRRGDHSPAEPLTQSAPIRRDTFRQRKPNTSRPPSMHVDDYVARERNVDGTTSSNVISVPRVGPTSGRPPSIHVDEFIARQKERQNHVGMVVSESTTQAKPAPPEIQGDVDKLGKSEQQLKPDLDDDLQGIDIVFDGEESDSDDNKLPFPQPDDNLQQPASVIVEQSSPPHSIVAETESDANGSSQFLACNMDENQSEFSSRMSGSRPDLPLTRESSISSDRKYPGRSEDAKNVTSVGFDSAAKASSSSRFSSSLMYNNRHSGPSSVQPADSRMRHHPSFYRKNNNPQQVGIGSQGFYDQKFQSQPPLPPMPPPPTILPVQSQTADQLSPFVNSMADVQPPLPPGFSSRVQPPLPPTPPPYSASPSLKTSTSQSSSVYNQTGSTEFMQSDARWNNLSASGAMLTSYPPPLMPPMLFPRPTSIPMNLYATNSTSHQGENPSNNTSQNLPIALSSIHSIQSLGLQPLQPPQQLPRPPQPPPQHLRPPVPASPQSDQGGSLLQSPVNIQQLQMLQPPQVSPAPVYYPTLQQENLQHTLQLQRVEQAQLQVQHQQGHGTSQPQDDIGMSLQHYFSSPEAIQSLLSDRDKLCQLLEQHPKLMQMLQERLGQL